MWAYSARRRNIARPPAAFHLMGTPDGYRYIPASARLSVYADIIVRAFTPYDAFARQLRDVSRLFAARRHYRFIAALPPSCFRESRLMARLPPLRRD